MKGPGRADLEARLADDLAGNLAALGDIRAARVDHDAVRVAVYDLGGRDGHVSTAA